MKAFKKIENINPDYFQFINKTLAHCQPDSIVKQEENDEFNFYLFDYRILTKYWEREKCVSLLFSCCHADNFSNKDLFVP